jgi:pimeloyl-ACP methyl ester carboxylesterase
MQLHVERYGAGEKIVFIHGAGGSAAGWYSQREYLKRACEVVLLDLPGHGQSGERGCRSIEEYTASVKSAIKENGLEGCYLAGHSMGGMIAMHCAVASPHMLKGLILIGTGARLRVFPQILEGILKDKEKTVEGITRFAFSKKAPDAMVQSGFSEMMKSSADVIYGDFYACDKSDMLTKVKEIASPTLVICGLDDALTPPKYSEFLAREIPNAQLVLVPDAGHMVMLEKPGETNRAIETFAVRR